VSRLDYVEKREPEVYVQIIFDTADGEKNTLVEGMKASIVGWTTHDEVKEAKVENYGYDVKVVPVSELSPIKELKSYLDDDTIEF
jgi:hypothetical protein